MVMLFSSPSDTIDVVATLFDMVEGESSLTAFSLNLNDDEESLSRAFRLATKIT